MSNTLYHHPVQEVEAYTLTQFQTLDQQFCKTNVSHTKNLSVPSSLQKYCTFDSSITACCPVQNSSPSVNFSPENDQSSSKSESCLSDGGDEFRNKLRELETAMLGPDSDIDSYENIFDGAISTPEVDNWREMMETIPKGDLKSLLISCAKAISKDDLFTTECLMAELRQMVSVSGEPIQRLGAYVLEGLVARLSSSGSLIYKSLRCKEPESMELLSYMHILYEVCPYFKFGYMSANGAIAEAMKNENSVHIIDFQVAQGSQWVTLIQAFAARPGGPPHIRITGIDDATSAFARGGGLSIVGQRLSRLAESCKVPFEFNAVDVPNSEVRAENLRIQPGEAISVNFPFVLHHMPDESVSTQNHRDRVLRLVKSLNPKVVTLIEQECNVNTSPFFSRFVEALDYYTAMFESIDVTLPRDHKERINVEQHCIAREVVNVIACEGMERVERHELLGKWKLRFKMAGFSPYPLSSLVNSTIKTLLENYSEKYRLEERDEALYLGWMNRDLVSSCAWK